MGPSALKNEIGFTALETLVAIVIVGIMSAVSIKPMTGLLQRIKLQTAADGMKHYILNARIRAVSNSNRHCGIVIRVHGSPTVDDTVFAFLEASPPDNNYTKGRDSLYLSPFVVKRKDGMTSTIPAGFPTVIVFRGDGSATASAKIAITLKGYQDTIDVLASTGKVKVKVR